MPGYLRRLGVELLSRRLDRLGKSTQRVGTACDSGFGCRTQLLADIRGKIACLRGDRLGQALRGLYRVLSQAAAGCTIRPALSRGRGACVRLGWVCGSDIVL